MGMGRTATDSDIAEIASALREVLARLDLLGLKMAAIHTEAALAALLEGLTSAESGPVFPLSPN